jgi:hypothetical protein
MTDLAAARLEKSSDRGSQPTAVTKFSPRAEKSPETIDSVRKPG